MHDTKKHKVIYKYCSISYKHGKVGATTNFLHHIKNKHPDRDTSNLRQPKLHIVSDSINSKFTFDSNMAQIDYLLAFIASEKPFSEVENSFIMNFFTNSMQAQFIPFSRRKAVRICLEQFHEQKAFLISLF